VDTAFGRRQRRGIDLARPAARRHYHFAGISTATGLAGGRTAADAFLGDGATDAGDWGGMPSG